MEFVLGATAPGDVSLEAHWFLVHPAGVVMRLDDGTPRLPCRSDVLALGLDPDAADYIGRLDGRCCFALSVDDTVRADPWVTQSLFSLFALLGDELFVAAGRAVQLTHFAQTYRYCGRCGGRTERVSGEHAVRCWPCELSFYPRVSPAIIVLVRRGEQVLLARGGRFRVPVYSTLAGFVEPGESLEQTLVREVREEVAIEVANIRYFGSQPWPFPHSLMMGFTAEYESGTIQIDGKEIVDARWFSRDDLPNLPPNPSIARRLIDAWLREVNARR